VDLITRGSGAKIPTLEVEALLLRHPRVAEVVLIGYPDPDVPGSDLACAAVVPRGVPPTRDELCRHLEKEQMSSRMWPDRVEIVAALPKNSLGKVLRHELRAQLDERLVAVGGG
jgi:cyclohexanecarboxylate-CoA ligase